MSRVVIALFLILLQSAHQAAWANEQEDIAKKIDALIAQKSKMKTTYSLRIRVDSSTPTMPPPDESSWGASFNIWRDGDKFRVDKFDAHHVPKRDPKYHIDGSRSITCDNCERSGYVVTTTVLPGEPTVLNAVEFHRIGKWNGDPFCTRLDWRYLGLANASLCLYDQQKSGVAFPAFFREKGVQSRQANRGGLPCVIADLKKEKYDTSVWLSSQFANNPVYFEQTIRLDDGPQVSTTEVTWQETKGGVLYPKTVKNKSVIRTSSGKHNSEEVITVLHADFESPVDPLIFTIPGFGLNENQAIGFPEIKSEDHPLWRNGKIDYEYTSKKRFLDEYRKSHSPASNGTPPPAPPTNEYPTDSNSLWIVSIVTGSLSALLAIAALVIRWRRRTQS